ncbi:MAG: hypothetical protein ACKV2O_02745 [Acidimicrobiales bacterium]
MQINRFLFACERCGQEFVPNALGRRPLYCGRTCRQRAYEARRRAAVQHLRLTPQLTPVLAEPVEPRVPRPEPRYEAGRNRRVIHALRVEGPADVNGDRPTLCGSFAQAEPTRRYFGDPRFQRQRPCRTCERVAERFPLKAPIVPPADLSHMKHVLAGGLAGFLADDPGRQRTTLLFLYRLANLPQNAWTAAA